MPQYNALANRPSNMLAYPDSIRATPRNEYLGGLADFLARSYAPQRTQQMQGVSQFLQVPAISQTLDRMSYGETLTTGSGGLGGTTRVRPEVLDAAMAVAPMTKPAAAASLLAARTARIEALKAAMAGERYAERVVPQIMERGGMPAQLLSDLGQGTRRQIFIGKTSKSWNQAAEEQALKMEKAGEKPEDIWMATGTFRGPEGKLRQEISDTGAKLTLGQGKPDAYGAIEAKTFEGALEHPRLQKAYPELNEVKFQHWPKEEYQGASFDPADNVITMGQKAMEPERGVALHELQHAIQQKEGFAKGGSASEFQNMQSSAIPFQVVNDAMLIAENAKKAGQSVVEFLAKPPRFIRSMSDDAKQLAMSRSDLNSLQKEFEYSRQAFNPEDSYQRLAGEAEARAVQARRQMSPEELRATYPYQSYDVPLNQLIVRTK
jgi:hypothetical protein